MRYSMEELIPVVAKLAEKYTSKESSSIPYAKAQQLMGAVIYCLNECETGFAQGTGLIPAAAHLDAEEAYQAGYQIVLARLREAQNQYSRMVIDFNSYGSRACQETVVDGITAFFQYYDARFNPQDHLLTLDYPLLNCGEKLSGVDRIVHYLGCVELEQGFLGRLPEDYVYHVLRAYDENYGELFINLAAVVYRNLVGCMLAGKRIDMEPYTDAELARLTQVVRGSSREALEALLGARIDYLAGRQPEGGQALGGYLKCDLGNFRAELSHAVEHQCLERVLAV